MINDACAHAMPRLNASLTPKVLQKSRDVEYILVVVDYVSKWVEALPCRAADSKHAKKMFHEVIFP